jgi:hypothetical protein
MVVLDPDNQTLSETVLGYAGNMSQEHETLVLQHYLGMCENRESKIGYFSIIFGEPSDEVM